MKLILSLLSALVFTVSIYTLEFNDANGNPVAMSQYEGKRILLVNIATGSNKVSQLAGLQQLHETYGDSVVIIAFPSNSFGHEDKSNAEIKTFCQSNYGVTFTIAEKNPVIGLTIQPVYNWLAQISQNGIMNGVVIGDFQKFLIDKHGKIIGIFSPGTEPLSSTMTEALTMETE